MYFNHRTYVISKSHWELHFNNIFDMASTCYKNNDPTKLTKVSLISCLHIFPMAFQCFHVEANRHRFGKVIKTLTDMFQHEALKCAHVHEMTLCVTSGAPHFRTFFALPTCMLKIYSNSYAFAHTCPPNHTGRNVWRTPPFDSAGPLGPPVGRPGHQGCPKTPEPVHLGTIKAANVTQ